jgi:hypothetical protein
MAMLTAGQFLIVQGQAFVMAQRPLDWAHWFLLAGAVILMWRLTEIPVGWVGRLGRIAMVAGGAAFIGMSVIDFALWSSPSEAARQAFSNQLQQTPAISLPFMSVGPSLLFLGLGALVLEWVAAMRWRVGLVLGGIALVGFGQFGNARWFVVGGHLVILGGLGAMWHLVRSRRVDSLGGLKFCLVVSGLALLLSGSATAQGTRGASFEFALIGDMPYDATHEREFANVMKGIDAADLAFVIHNGDFWWDGKEWTEKAGGLPPCGDETFQDRLGLAKSSRHPFIFVSGDNEWADCYRAKPRTYDPLERLAKLRQMFFQGDQSLGRRTMRLTRQSEDARYARFRENVRWIHGDVLFVTLHVIGSNNNLGRTPEMDAEYAERTSANLEWMRQAFALASRGGSRAIMIIAQANPRFETSWPPRHAAAIHAGGSGVQITRNAKGNRLRRVPGRAGEGDGGVR